MSPALPLSGVIDHPALGQVRYQIQETSSDPDAQVEQTIGLMRQYVLGRLRPPDYSG